MNRLMFLTLGKDSVCTPSILSHFCQPFHGKFSAGPPFWQFSWFSFLSLFFLPEVYLIHRYITIVPLPHRHVFMIQDSKSKHYACSLWAATNSSRMLAWLQCLKLGIYTAQLVVLCRHTENTAKPYSICYWLGSGLILAEQSWCFSCPLHKEAQFLLKIILSQKELSY